MNKTPYICSELNSWFEKSHLCISLKQSKTLDHCKINQYTTYIHACMHTYIQRLNLRIYLTCYVIIIHNKIKNTLEIFTKVKNSKNQNHNTRFHLPSQNSIIHLHERERERERERPGICCGKCHKSHYLVWRSCWSKEWCC